MTDLRPETRNRITIIQHVLKTWNRGTQEFTDEQVLELAVNFLVSFLMNLGKGFSTMDHLKAAMKVTREEKDGK